MGTVKRRSRHRFEDRDPITLAWDKGLPPPPKALEAYRRDEVIDVMFFRWIETGSHALDHPYRINWREALHLGQPTDKP